MHPVRQEVRAQLQFPHSLTSSLGDWLRFGATSCSILNVAGLGVNARCGDIKLPALLLATSGRERKGRAGKGREAGVSGCPAKSFPELRPPSAGQSRALHCQPGAAAGVLQVSPAREACPPLSQILHGSNKLRSRRVQRLLNNLRSQPSVSLRGS